MARVAEGTGPGLLQIIRTHTIALAHSFGVIPIPVSNLRQVFAVFVDVLGTSPRTP